MSATAQTINTICLWLDYMVAYPMILLGTIGAILTILVFVREKKFWRNKTIIYLVAGAAMTSVHLPSIYLPIILIDSVNVNIINLSDAGSRVFNYFLHVTTVSAMSYPCWAAFDQYASTCREARFRNRWSSLRVIRAAVIGTPILWMIVYSPVLCVSSAPSDLGLPINATLTKILNYFLTPLVSTVIPSVVIVLCLKGTINNLRSTVLTDRHDRLVKQIRRMLFPQLFLLIISGFPPGILAIYLEATGHEVKNELRQAIERIIVQMGQFFYHFNFVFTFYIYFYMSNEVRQASKRLFGKCFSRHHTVEPITMTDNNQRVTFQTQCSTYPVQIGI